MLCGLWDLSSLTRDQTWAIGSESMDLLPLDHQGTPFIINKWVILMITQSWES